MKFFICIILLFFSGSLFCNESVLNSGSNDYLSYLKVSPCEISSDGDFLKWSIRLENSIFCSDPPSESSESENVNNKSKESSLVIKLSFGLSSLLFLLILLF